MYVNTVEYSKSIENLRKIKYIVIAFKNTIQLYSSEL